MVTDYLFVYGSLLKNAKNEISVFLSFHAKLLGKAYFYGKLFDVSWFPGAVLSLDTTEKVYGSVYEITEVTKVFEVLDEYEGVAEKLFKRVKVEAYLESENMLETWVYVYNHSTDRLKHIVSGDYLQYSAKK